MSEQYQVRISARARRLRMQVDSHGQLLVVVPANFDQRHIPRFIHQHKDWIAHARQKAAQAHAKHPELFETRPEQIYLPALSATWQVEYVTTGQRALWRDVDGALLVRADQEAMIKHALGDWLTVMAKQFLPQRLRLMANDTGLNYSGVTIRAQKTRWGSCSSKQNINLNRNLLFLPLPLVDYLCLHELCHTRVMNHSEKFWRQVASFEPDYARLERSLTLAARQVPQWARS
ncbi:MAG: M48 family metallopeptidase [Gammaproteobacteria bacterium]|nr:M48 family metallopeptidase [Gammaproteobacteria bacterium]